jgi:hypothetical protein
VAIFEGLVSESPCIWDLSISTITKRSYILHAVSFLPNPDIVFGAENTQNEDTQNEDAQNEDTQNEDAQSAAHTGNAAQEEETPNDEFEFGDFEDLQQHQIKKRKRKPVVQNKTKWTVNEEEEIKVLFKKFFDSKKRPKPIDCVKAMELSRKNNGAIHYRKKDVLKKKVFRMVDKLL